MIAIVGGGRMGRGLAMALADAGERVVLWSRREATGGVEEAVAGAAGIVLAVPDDAIAGVATDLAKARAVEADQIILHVSGLHGRSALAALAESGAALGSFHPLQTISDPATAATRWHGAYAAVEGDDRAVAEAERLALRLGLVPFRLTEDQKPIYHAGAVLAANYVVALAGTAARLAEAAGVPTELAGRLYQPLIAGAAENLREQSPAAALTGPVRRGDLATLRAHLAALNSDDRHLYARLGIEALQLARQAGLSREPADAVGTLLQAALE
jgi:predicted short-subunit dehydrogenase-like oxidoreductase (DUF2520 family)